MTQRDKALPPWPEVAWQTNPARPAPQQNRVKFGRLMDMRCVSTVHNGCPKVFLSTGARCNRHVLAMSQKPVLSLAFQSAVQVGAHLFLLAWQNTHGARITLPL